VLFLGLVAQDMQRAPGSWVALSGGRATQGGVHADPECPLHVAVCLGHRRSPLGVVLLVFFTNLEKISEILTELSKFDYYTITVNLVKPILVSL
jgi:hypothetical protein